MPESWRLLGVRFRRDTWLYAAHTAGNNEMIGWATCGSFSILPLIVGCAGGEKPRAVLAHFDARVRFVGPMPVLWSGQVSATGFSFRAALAMAAPTFSYGLGGLANPDPVSRRKGRFLRSFLCVCFSFLREP